MTARIAIHGYYGHHNVGDEAILAVILRELRRRLPDASPVVLSADPDWTSRVHGVEAVPWEEPVEVAAAIRRASLVISGGGGLFQDYWHRDNADVLFLPAQGVAAYAQAALLAELYGKPLVLLAHGMGPIRTDEGARLVRLVATMADRISVRDDESAQLLEQLGCGDRLALVAPDPAFAFPVPSRDEARRRLREHGLALDERPVLGVVVRPWMEDGADWPERVARALDLFVAQNGARVLFVPFHESAGISDRAQAQAIAARMSERSRCVVLGEQVPAEAATALAACDSVLAMRMHSAIFGLAAGVPVLALAYDPKVTSVMRQARQEQRILPVGEGLEPEQLAEELVNLHRQGRAIAEELGPVAKELAERALDHFEGLEELLARGRGGEADLDPDRFVRRKTLSEEVAELRIRAEQSEHRYWEHFYEKEAYIQGLRRELRLARALGLMGPVWLVRRGARFLSRTIRGLLPKVLPARWRLFYKEVRRPVFSEEGRGEVTLYHRQGNPLPTYPRRVNVGERGYREQTGVSVVVTVRNEADSVGIWLKSLISQTRPPDEVILVDGGSTDGTLGALQDFAAETPLPVKVVAAGEVNIAQGRNLGIAQARHGVIATTDLGCELDPGWLESLVAPFELDPETDVVIGWYEPKVKSSWGRAVARHLVWRLEEVDPATLLPSSRSVAFTKKAWQAVGGYPEWLTLTGEDTYFALELQRHAPKWAFAPEAKVFWHAPERLLEAMRRAYRWAWGNGEAGLFPDRYWLMLERSVRDLFLLAVLVLSLMAALVTGGRLILVPALLAGVALAGTLARATAIGVRKHESWWGVGLWLLTAPAVRVARVLGFLDGVRHRPRALARLLTDMEHAVFILSGVPLTDSGGGQRATQLALAFLDRGDAVVFVHRFPSYESVHLNISIGHPLLLSFSWNTFDLEAFFARYPQLLEKRRTVLVEFPLLEFTELAERLRDGGATVAYDCIDDWTTSLGGGWYSADTEKRLIEASQVLVSTAETLRDRLAGLSGREVALAPNAVNTRLFRPGSHPRPPDLEEGDFVITYVGALWGEWFDWELLGEAARAYPHALVVVIGDYRGQFPDPPPNLRFLGLKQQSELPAYLAHTDVAIIPWIVSRITDATNPLKVYEYLAMHRPVVASAIKALEGIPYVLLARNHEEFVRRIDEARRLQVDEEVVEAFVRENSWPPRVDHLMELVDEARTAT